MTLHTLQVIIVSGAGVGAALAVADAARVIYRSRLEMLAKRAAENAQDSR